MYKHNLSLFVCVCVKYTVCALFLSPANHPNESRVKWSRPYAYERMGCVSSYSFYLCMDFTLSILLRAPTVYFNAESSF